MMVENPRRPLLNPVLRFKKDPKPESITGGGKNAKGIKRDRLAIQKETLANQFMFMAENVNRIPSFADRVIIYVTMFEDSFAATWTPTDLFKDERGTNLIAPYRSGYLIELNKNHLNLYKNLILNSKVDRELVDISRVESVRFFKDTDTYKDHSLNALWEAAPQAENGKAFMMWFMPLLDANAADSLLDTFLSLRETTIYSPDQLLSSIDLDDEFSSADQRHASIISTARTTDRLSLSMRIYRKNQRSKTTIVAPSLKALERIVTSGMVFRIEPAHTLNSSSPGDGIEPERPLPQYMTGLPVVGVVDGGLTASSYIAARAWNAAPLVKDVFADTKHGNRIASLIVQGHEWNNQLSLPKLYCQVGVAQAVAKEGSSSYIDPQNFITYLDSVMTAHPETKVWNLSLNQKDDCDLDSVSYLGHEISLLARKHGVLPIISVGNKPGSNLQPPADCEAAITVGGRLHNADGLPAGQCPVSHSGPGPSSMLKPDLSHFSHVRAIGGVQIKGSSFSTALTSPLAAHTMSNLREPTPDLVKSLLLHNSDGTGFDPALGFGTSGVSALPWECRPGYVTLQWQASLRPGAAYYWELPIPQSLQSDGKLKGVGTLTAILNPHPLISDYAGPNYFSARLATALQYKKSGSYSNLLGTLDTDKIKEKVARAIDHKWSPIRHHHRDFQKGIIFDEDKLRVYARIYTRDLYHYGYKPEDVPKMDAVFVLSLGSNDINNDIYNQIRNQLGVFVETSVVDVNIDVQN